MPGWDDNTWGLHADGGTFFHRDGWPKDSDHGRTYTTGDVIGCCIETAERKAAFTKNGIVLGEPWSPLNSQTNDNNPTNKLGWSPSNIGARFTGVTSRVFPVVALGSGNKVTGNFGNARDKPFRYPEGANWVHTAETEIEAVDRLSVMMIRFGTCRHLARAAFAGADLGDGCKSEFCWYSPRSPMITTYVVITVS
ncbi:hypothetical protein BJY04DRAFT_224723 [Aspergillus karnatakaensis]|uniref:SPRY domain-containing protein n=1 Tax=Aspergillus karnatakaensis TaxID=1810916 RepID=UPI003CCD7C26